MLFAFALAPFAIAAEPAPETPVDTSFVKLFAETRGFMLGRPVKPKFTPDGKTVLFLRSDATTPKQSLFATGADSGFTVELLSPETLLKGTGEELSAEEKARRERQRVNVGGFADYDLDPAGKRVLVMLAGKPFVYEIATKKVTELAVGKGTIIDPKWSPDGKLVGYIRDYDVNVYDLATGKEAAVTTGGTKLKTHGLAEFVAQEEMGRHTGYWWSPDSKFIAYEEADHTGVEVWSIADPLRPDVKAQEQFYPRPGKKNVSVRLGIVPASGGETVWFDPMKPIARAGGMKFEYLAKVTWDANGPLTLVMQDRLQRHPTYFELDPKTGVATAFHTAPEKYGWVNLRPDEPRWLSDGRYLIGYEGSLSDGILVGKPHEAGRVVVSPDDKHKNIDILAFSDKYLFYSAHSDSPNRHVFRVALKNVLDQIPDDVPTSIAGGDGLHSAIFSKNCTFVATTSTSLDQMPVTTIDSVEGQQRSIRLPSVAFEPKFKPNVTIQNVGDYWTAVVKPKDFDPAKKYPVIVDVYGGPRHLHVVQAMRNWLIPQWIANQGFIVVAIENRGTPGRGREWEQAIYQKFGTVPLDDQAKGLAALGAKFPELDLSRVGIIGWSFGGYMATNAVLRKPDVFHAAVAGAPVTDWEDYDTHYTERYMGLLPESKQAYDEASLLPLAKNLRRPLLLVHGTADDNVYFRHTLRLTDALTRAGKSFEVLPLPGVTHMITADPVAFEQYYARSIQFFHKHLGSPK